MTLVAFELEPSLAADDLNGATVAYGPSTLTFDVKAALLEGEGTIVTDDPQLAATLRGFPVLVPGDVPDGATPVVVPGAEEGASEQPTIYVPQEPLNLGPQAPADVPAAPVVSTDEVPAVHADEPATVEEAAEPPAGQGDSEDNEPTTPSFGRRS